MEYINHITLNTGHIRKSYSHEINKEVYFVLNRIYKDIFNDGAKVYGEFTAKGTFDPENGVIITLFGAMGEPIITTGISDRKRSLIWKLLHDTSTAPLITKPQFPPKAPYIADRLEIGALTNMDALKWTGDFTRCMGWICLAPEKIR